jgi:integrase
MLTVKGIPKLQPGQKASDGGPRGSGALWVKRTLAGALVFTFRYSVNRRVMDMALGTYAEKGQDGLTLEQARAKAAELQRMIQSGIPDPKAWQEEQGRLKAEGEAQAQAAAEAALVAAQRAVEERTRFSLAALLRAYTDHLERMGKTQAARDVRSIFKVNILTPAPGLAALPAKEVTKAALAARIREVREAGTVRTAGKLRSYLFAAYDLAARAEGDTEAPAEMIRFGIEVNPVAGIRAIPVRPGDRALSREELRTFIGKLNPESLPDQALKLCLYAGGQRAEQLLRARVSDFDPSSGILRLLDGKGRRQIPREHRLPLSLIATELVKGLVARAREEQPEELDPPLFANGAKVMVPTTLTHRTAELAASMEGARFIFRDLRRSCETEMAALGFSTDLRAQLLSHGLGGIQTKHYDRHGYMPEKKAALEEWERHLEGQAQPATGATVVSIAARRRAA